MEKRVGIDGVASAQLFSFLVASFFPISNAKELKKGAKDCVKDDLNKLFNSQSSSFGLILCQAGGYCLYVRRMIAEDPTTNNIKRIPPLSNPLFYWRQSARFHVKNT